MYDAVLIIRTDEALRQFGSHRFSLGADVSVAAGPRGAGQGAEGSLPSQRKHNAGSPNSHPQVYSYMRSKGVYAGIEVVGTAFISRTEENEMMYHAPGIKPVDIVSARAVHGVRDCAELHLSRQCGTDCSYPAACRRLRRLRI